MKLSRKNLGKPSNKKLKFWADILLYTMPLYLTAIMTAPIGDELKGWLNLSITVIVITAKAFTKFTSNEDNITDTGDNSPDSSSISRN